MKLTPIEIVRGRDFEMTCYFDDVITLWAPRAQVRANAAMTSALITDISAQVGAFAEQIDPLTNGVFYACPVTLTIPRVLTASIEQDTGYWDLALFDLNGALKTYVGGPVAIVDFPTTGA